mgnify:CR=1 FL=1|jgi:hypothetical protein
MKAIALGNRLARDLGGTFTEMDADARLEVLDAINGGLQRLHAVASHKSKITTAGIYLPAPSTVSLGLTNGSADVTGHTFTSEDFYRTIRIDGDPIDNQIISETELLHPYAGSTGTVDAIIYSDAATVPEPYDELVGNPVIMETRRELLPFQPVANPYSTRHICEPEFYHVEANSRNQNPHAPSVIRFNSLPGVAYRLSAKFTLAPARIAFSDLLSPGADIPMRAEHVELYLLPVARGLLATSDLWKNPDTRGASAKAGEIAAADYDALVPRTLATPSNFARTKRGF